MPNYKELFLQKLAELDTLNIPKHSYAITGSGPLAIHNLRPAKDVDIIIKRDLWKKLLEQYMLYDVIHVYIGNIDIWGDCFNLTYRQHSVIDTAKIIDGYPFMTLQDTIIWKQFLNREKDLRDITLIQAYLQNKEYNANTKNKSLCI